MTKLLPAQGYYLIEPLELPQSKGTILQARNQDQAYKRGKILDVGLSTPEDGVMLDPEVQAGAVVWYAYSGFEDVQIEKDNYHVVRFRALVAIEHEKK
jgi:co-chaperonin GroES (HSP10)